MTRRIFMTALALAAFGLSAWILLKALVAEALTGQVFFAVMPLLMLGGLAWNARARDPNP
ncbi:MAG: hypothetical protein ACRBCL_12070 [Maritimibacter sp.]